MFSTEYPALIAAYQGGGLARFDARNCSPETAWMHSVLTHYSSKDWDTFDGAMRSVPAEVMRLIAGELEFLKGTALLMRARYDEAAACYREASRIRTPACLLAIPEIIEYDLYVVRTFQESFRFQDEIPLLRRLRSSEVAAPLVILSYGNHYFVRGQFQRALELYRKAFALHSRNLHINNHILIGTMGVRAAVQAGALSEAEKLLNQVSKLVQRAGNPLLKERYDIAYAEYLMAIERYDESLTHVEFSLNQKVSVENAWLLLLQAQVLLSLGRGSREALPLLKQVEVFAHEHKLSEDSVIDLYSLLAAAEMESESYPAAYRHLLKAETMAYSHHNAYLRAQVMIQKARLSRRQNKPAAAARILIEVLQVTMRQKYFIPACQAIRSMGHAELFETMEAPDRALLSEILEAHHFEKYPSRAAHALKQLRQWLDTSPPAHPPAAPKKKKESADRLRLDEAAIYFDRGGKDPAIITKTHRLPGKLLVEFLKSPNRDLSFDHLHMSLWGGPIRNESHIQKLKTLVSRLRTDLKEKGVPIDIESREYATYRAVTSVPVES